jgi:hypothetical protein
MDSVKKNNYRCWKYRVIINDCSRSKPCPRYEIFAALCIILMWRELSIKSIVCIHLFLFTYFWSFLYGAATIHFTFSFQANLDYNNLK